MMNIKRLLNDYTIDLLKAASVWVAEQIGLKKRDYREKKNLDGNAELKEI